MNGRGWSWFEFSDGANDHTTAILALHLTLGATRERGTSPVGKKGWRLLRQRLEREL